MNPIGTPNNTSKSMIALNASLLTEYQSLIDRVFSSIAANAEGKQTDRPPVDIMKDIVELDKKMQQGLEQSKGRLCFYRFLDIWNNLAFSFIRKFKVEEHQRVHRKILQVINEIEAENNAIMEFVNELKNGKEQLEICLDAANETIQAINFASASSVTADEILKYANRISSYTSAPPNYVAGTFAEPPYPDESRMRRGFLFRQDVDMVFEDGMTHCYFMNPYNKSQITRVNQYMPYVFVKAGDKNDDENEEEEDSDDIHYVKSNLFGPMDVTQQAEPFTLDLNPELE
ncbi:2333_t:CDS:2 [Scutellospora calospora]|uniref:2333_t:CDS:1 n=1 Tax=Scutellospora calospora TaxID=85575 RepID=A0ACA9MKV4_9GLOM|nr:2333_t:CDS:2 [Scutellospora calospora]